MSQLAFRRTLAAAAVSVALLLCAIPIRADYDAVLAALEQRHHRAATTVPMLGLARFAVWIVHPNGIHDFRLATFEHSELRDAGDMAALVRAKAGAGFHPLIDVRSTKRGEWTVVLAQPLGAKLMRLLVFTHDHEDTTLVQADVDMQLFAERMDRPVTIASIGR